MLQVTKKDLLLVDEFLDLLAKKIPLSTVDEWMNTVLPCLQDKTPLHLIGEGHLSHLIGVLKEYRVVNHEK